MHGALPKPLVLQQLVELFVFLPAVALHHGEVQQGDQGGKLSASGIDKPWNSLLFFINCCTVALLHCCTIALLHFSQLHCCTAKLLQHGTAKL